MLQTRPQYAELLLPRPRLLHRLPEERGYVVWLQAPYGYGKSVLLSQWADHLENLGQRTLWLSLAGTDARSALTLALELPEATPWPVLLAELRHSGVVLVLEEVEGNENLGPLLHHLPGLIALASRGALPEPELLRLQAQGRLVHLDAQDLAFSQDEAERLFSHQDQARAALERTGGWPLPLHLTALTGQTLFGPALWAGLKESLTPEQWQALLLLSALPFLPSVTDDQTGDQIGIQAQQLAKLGFVQVLEGGYRLHPLTAAELSRWFAAERSEAVRRGLVRLPKAAQAEACARAGLWPELTNLLEDDRLADEDSPGVLRWHALCLQHLPGQPKPGRSLCVSWALSVTGKLLEAQTVYLEAARHPQASIKQRLKGLSWAISELPGNQLAQAEALLAEARPWLAQAQPESQAAFWGNTAIHHMNGFRWDMAQTMLEKALTLQAGSPGSPNRINLAQVRWEARGELRSYLEQLAQTVDRSDLLAFNRLVNMAAAGLLESLRRPQQALSYFDRLTTLSRHNPLEALRGRAEAAAIRLDLTAFPALESEARAWAEAGNEPGAEALGRVVALWGRTLRRVGQAAEACKLLKASLALPELLIGVELALALAELGQPQEGLTSLAPALAAPYRFVRLHAWAAQYRLTHDLAALEQVLNLTSEGEQVLPTLIPLTDLPPTLPALSQVYPLREVLASGWKAAIELRQSEIPPLELRMLGEFQVKVLGQVVPLQTRPRELLTLLALGHSRASTAEVLWPEADSAKSRNNLHVNLNSLRRQLEPWGLPTYLSETGLVHIRCDLWDLQAALQSGDWPQVRRLYRPLAPEITLAPVAQRQAALYEEMLTGALQYCQGLPAVQREDWLGWLLRHDPLHEQALAQLLMLLLSSGRRSAAERRYLAYQRQLHDELGLEPDQHLQKLLS